MQKQLLIIVLLLFPTTLVAKDKRPNIVVIYADDMGYGDVQHLNPERGKIATPNIDTFAKQGMVFTDAHTTSSVCTPSRYSLMTGRYNWRTRLQKGVTWGYSQPLISDDTLTVGKLLQKSNYKTAMIGKWHLGMTLPTTDGKACVDKRLPKKTNVDWEGAIANGPADRGFDYYFGISASLDMAPYIYIENRNFTSKADNSQPKKPAEGFSKIDVLNEFGNRCEKYIQQHEGDRPFFLYVPLTSPHTPILPTPKWQGKSGINKYADFQMQTDAVIGQIVNAVDAFGLADNTLVIITSDNGCSRAANFAELEAAGHFASAQFRGSKTDLWEGGHRVPFLVRWPSIVQAGSESDQTISQADLLATVAEIVGFEVPTTEGEDSVSFLAAFKGKKIVSTRKGIFSHSGSGHFAYRMGDWKLLLAKGSGGWTAPTEKEMLNQQAVPEAQLYNLAKDPGESNNLYDQEPEKAAELLAQLTADINNGRSTAGPKQSNDIPSEKIRLWKSK